MAERRRRRRPDSGGGGGNWLTTYGDMVTLLLTFFVFLFAFSTVDVQKFEKLLLSFQGALGVMPGGKSVEEETTNPMGGQPERDAGSSSRQTQDVRHISERIVALVRREQLESQISITVDQRGIIISLSEQVLYETGSVNVRPEGQRLIHKIGLLLAEVPNALSVEGHTDSIPLRGGPYRDNWGLSAMRAAGVASFLMQGGIDPGRLQAVGFGSTKPLVPNDTPEHQRLNRRVDLVVLSQYPRR